MTEGQDKCEAALVENKKNSEITVDEIQAYQDGRYLCAPEACASLFRFEPNRKSHTVQRLPVHLDNQQRTVFEESQAQAAVDAGPRHTELLAYFDLNKGDGLDEDTHRLALSLLYHDIPKHFKFKKGIWVRRKTPTPDNIKSAWCKNKPVIGRMHDCSIKDEELYSLRSLLLHVKGARSYDDLKTVEVQTTLDDGDVVTERVLCETFLEASVRLGLRGVDAEYDNVLRHARHDHMPGALRSLFASILVHCNPLDPDKLWDKHRKYFWDDRTWEQHREEYDFRAYHSIERMVQRFNSNHTLEKNFKIPVPPGNFVHFEEQEREEFDSAQGLAMLASLKPTQREHYDKIIAAIETGQGSCFFLDGPGGSGKSYLYQTLTHNVRATGKSVLCVASTGIAATLINGMTAHKQFGLPVPCHENSTSHIRPSSKEATLLRNATLLIWDESSMAHKDMLGCMDRLLRDLMSTDAPFGGKCLVLGGDFRQCLPVVPHGTSAQQASACLKSSTLWPFFEQLSLSDNIRAEADSEFAPWLLRVGDGLDGNTVDLDHHGINIKYSQEELIEQTFGETINRHTLAHLRKTVILAPTNRTTLELNDIVLNKMPVESTYRYSEDRSKDNDENPDMLPQELLHELHPPGMPPHKLHLKEGAVYMLLRNMNIKLGLCNGSRFVLLDCSNQFVLKCQLIPAGPVANEDEPTVFYLPRITCTPTDQYPFLFTRKQFPILPAFAMTINKSQGGTFDKVGIDLSTCVFSHGQLYVALSRVRSFDSLCILLPEGDTTTRNHVFQQILNGSHRHVPPPAPREQPNPDGHFFRDDDNEPAADEEVIDAGQQHPSMYDHDSDHDDLPDEPGASDRQLDDEVQPADDDSLPLPNIPPPLPPPPPIIIDPLAFLDAFTYEHRMQMRDGFMSLLASQVPPPQPPPPPSPPHTPARQPTRRNPPRAARQDD